ncbi:23S rRNA (adenine(1618)-N(6))-methyltransferase RlmF [Simiduia aestuariiviva]|uniref:Ribosomal RNA large subunit methyltransferase F n=1 Tax=Simiduia aestuariiviva TaxID=1510459 RepID=A0A839UTZ2_9GAMM|nr:23S rRNA (adenine1618-N6)-methyltransferase [Simiduia aestuariiviva]
MSSHKPKSNNAKQLHPRNLHRHGYDFPALLAHMPSLAEFVAATPQGQPTIDYADPIAVKALNAALLSYHYGIEHWDIPDGALCPPIPGRIDYLHHVAELLGLPEPKTAPESGAAIKMLDIGTGANGVYALLAAKVYGWHCIATDISATSIDNVTRVLHHNPKLQPRIALRLQPDKHKIFEGIIQPDEHFDLSVCNPPFHASAEDALKANRRKVHNLSREQAASHSESPALNFGGSANELWCNGGEKLFLKKMAKESHAFKDQCRWFTSLVSNNDNLKPTEKVLGKLGATKIEVLEMNHGQKITRVLAWRY